MVADREDANLIVSENSPSGNDEAGHLPGNIKVTRMDWLNAAKDILVNDGVNQVKVLTIGERLNVSRSSFYWYFKSRQDLLDALLEYWQETNTAILVRQSALPSKSITEAVLNVFKCFLDAKLFNSALDFAVRDWSRRSAKVRRIMDGADEIRLNALSQMFGRHGYESVEALTRARILYFMQVGYNVADLNETLEQRLSFAPSYLIGFTGQTASGEEIAAFEQYAKTLKKENRS